MLDFCPLCHKNGYKRKITLHQINLQEAVWLCEYSECPWPFGYQEFTFVSRSVGETWSKEWEVRKPTALKSSEPFPISLNELGLDTPPVTPGSGSEVIHKDSVFGDGACIVTSLNSNTNNVIQAKANLGSLKNGSSKLRQSYASECGSIDTESTGTRASGEIYASQKNKSNDRDCKVRKSLNSVNRSLRDEETASECKGGFSLSNDVNFENLDQCLSASQGFIDACDAAEAATQSVFNVGKPSIDNLSMHDSTVKCKKWLSDNTNNTKGTAGGRRYSFSESKKVAFEFKNVSSEGLDHRLQRSSPGNLKSIKQRPIIRSIEKTNVNLGGVISVSNQCVRKKNKAFTATTENTSPTVVCDLTGIVKDEPEQNITSSNANSCIIVSDNSSDTCKIENRTLAIDGLLPINISYEVPSFVEEFTTVPRSTACKEKEKGEIVSLDLGQEQVVDNSVISTDVKVETADCAESKGGQLSIGSKTEMRRQSMKKPLKRTIPKLAKYQAFNFGTLKKKSKTNSEENIKSSLPNIPSPDNVSSCSDLTWTSEISCATSADSKSESVSSGIYNNAKSSSSVENCSPGTSSSDSKNSNLCSPENNGSLESNFNLDEVLDDLIVSNNVDLTEGFEDDWLDSLFN